MGPDTRYPQRAALLKAELKILLFLLILFSHTHLPSSLPDTSPITAKSNFNLYPSIFNIFRKMKYASPTSLLTISLILPSVLGISSFTPPAPDHAKRLVELGVTAGTCIDLGAKLDLRVAAATGLINGLAVANAKLDAGLCLCVDARTNVGVLTGDSLLAVGADINLYVQARADANVGTRLTGLNAPLLATSVSLLPPYLKENY